MKQIYLSILGVFISVSLIAQVQRGTILIDQAAAHLEGANVFYPEDRLGGIGVQTRLGFGLNDRWLLGGSLGVNATILLLWV